MNSWPLDQGRIGAGASLRTPALSLSMDEGRGLVSSAVVRPLGSPQPGEVTRSDSALREPSLKELRANESEKNAKDSPAHWKGSGGNIKDEKSGKERSEPDKYAYQDYSFAVSLTPGVADFPRRSSAQTMSFPERLYDILCREDTRDIITWLPHGRSWIILKPKVFESTMLPRLYSSRCKHSSFIRQANGWGFRRITQGPDQNSYYHELFLRGMPHLCKRMKRPGTFKKLPSDPDDEPDFHNMPPLPHLRPTEQYSAAETAGVNANAAEIAQQLQLEQQIAQQRRLLIESAVYNAISGNSNSAVATPHVQRMLVAQQREREALLQGTANNSAALLSALPIQQQNSQQTAAAELMASLPNVMRERLPQNDLRAAVLAASIRNNGRVGVHPLVSPPNVLASILRNSPAAAAAPEQGGAAQLNNQARSRRFASPIIPTSALLEQRAQTSSAPTSSRRWSGIDPSTVLALQLEESTKQSVLEDIARYNDDNGQQ
mmetsp:Transcript_9035/g.12499  ORF Transcript_9035/g.12499 Transcript_9035/m.12499 type:complete len:490 (-) Transcript_9035:163-1632(-)